ncbi:MAG: PAS domain-containing protein, partial [Alphaproteobacteria bacterium]|nr:PAS domain-containing protein [Alphaproteobacteria bacterium]
MSAFPSHGEDIPGWIYCIFSFLCLSVLSAPCKCTAQRRAHGLRARAGRPVRGSACTSLQQRKPALDRASSDRTPPHAGQSAPALGAPGAVDPAGAATFDAPEWRVRDLLQALPAAIYVTDADGRITYYNEAAASLWGCRPALGSSAWCAAWRLCRPDGAALAYDESPMAMALKHKRAIRGM